MMGSGNGGVVSINLLSTTGTKYFTILQSLGFACLSESSKVGPPHALNILVKDCNSPEA